MNTPMIAALFAMAALPVAAGTATPRVDPLEKGQAKVQKIEDQARADGKVTPRERARLAKAQDKQSKRIFKQKHDRQKQAPAT
jgi:hypothetical protein